MSATMTQIAPAQSLNRTPRSGCHGPALTLVRRLDWRYLLTEPSLRRVAYVGSSDGSLLAALSCFCDFLWVLPSRDPGRALAASPGAFDLVVVRSLRRADVEVAEALLRSGGELYWELDRRARSPAASSSNGGGQKLLWRQLFRDYSVLLERAGFVEVRAHWHHPDFEQCVHIIPLSHDSSIRFALSRRFDGVSQRMIAPLARYLAKTGSLARVAPCVSIIARNRTRA